MEFTRLAEVEVVETATDTDKVLIEQNGEIKRVPKTEVGGAGNALIIKAEVDQDSGELKYAEANMTLDECLNAINSLELTGAFSTVKASMEGMTMSLVGPCVAIDYSAMAGTSIIMITIFAADMELYWTADGFSMEPPEGMG